ncbi:hypothetical protein [Methanocaldococcus sp.]
MNILKGSILKVFGAVVLVSMIGALVAEPVALGDSIIKDAKLGFALMYYGAYTKNVRYTLYGSTLVRVGMTIPTIPGVWYFLAFKGGTIA